KRFVNACHEYGLAVVLDVVYNHFGPEGQVNGRFGEYHNDRFRTPWGEALNFDAAGSAEVRHFFLENARQWITEFHVDALRLDAVHAIFDLSAYPFLAELTDTVRAEAERSGRRALVMAESNLNNPRMIRPKKVGGYGFDAQWLDDFHHAIHGLLTGETRGYYADYGDLEQLAKCYREAFIFTGEYSAYRRCRYGAPAEDADFHQFVACIQNHDQIGNRLKGDRLGALVNLETQKLAAAALLAGPFVPLLFMGEEYGDPAPFPYFVSVTNPVLAKAIRIGRKQEFAAFGWESDPPDPQAVSTFESARLNLHLREQSPHRQLLQFYRKLLSLRSELRLGATDRDRIGVSTLIDDDAIMMVRHEHRPAPVALVLYFARAAGTLQLPLPAGQWQVVLDTADLEWAGPGSRCPPFLTVDARAELRVAPRSAILLTQTVAAQ
ncbi:MAG TPA: hypothetical protein VK864_12840, partial [Longimicrobiales bacterium]|nr:hypothetical protein [Longimicrobiales bacterium]